MNNMNFIEACGVLADSAELRDSDRQAHEARESVRDVVDAYDLLEPTAKMWLSGATHYVINADGFAEWLFGVSPEHQVVAVGAKWSKRYVWASEPDRDVDLPIGVDWRLCIWQRSEATP